MAAILTRNRRVPDDEMPEILSDDDLLAWGQSLVDVHVDEWTPDPSAEAGEGTAEEGTAEEGTAEEADEAVAEEPAAAEGTVAEAAGSHAETETVEVDAEAQLSEQPEPVAEARVAVEVERVEPVEPEVRPARISQRRRELVALRRHLAAQAAERRAAMAAHAGQAGYREQPLTGYRPGASPLELTLRHDAEGRTRLQERLAAATPVAPVRDGQWAAREVAAPTIRVRLAETD